MKTLLPGEQISIEEARGLDIHGPGISDTERTVPAARFNDQKALSIVTNRWHVADDYRRPYEEKWARWESQYRLVVKRTRDGSNLPSDEPFVVVETILPRIINAIFSVDPPFSINPENPGADLKVDLIQQLLDYQWDSQIDIRDYLTRFFRSVVKFGTGITKIIWEEDFVEDYVEVQDRDQNGIPTGNVTGKIRKYQSFDGPRYVHVPIYNFWLEPHARSIEEADWCIAEHWVPETILKELDEQGVYQNTDQLQHMRDTGDYSQADRYRSGSAYGGYGRDYMLKRSGRQSPFDFQDKYSPMVKVWEYYGSYYTEEGRRIPNRLITIADEKVVLRNIENPYSHGRKPFVECCYIKDELEFYGIGALESMEPHTIASQAVNNMVQDNLTYAIQKMFLVGRGARVPFNSIRFRAFGTIPVEDISQVKQLEVDDVVPSAIGQRAWLESRIQNVTGTTDFIRGGSAASRSNTATGVTQGTAQANIRFGIILQSIQGFLRRALTQQHSLNKQFLDIPQVIRIKGKEGHTWRMVQSRDIDAHVDFTLLGDDDTANDFQAQQRLLLLFDKILLDPVLRQTIDVREVVSEMFRTFKVRRGERLLLDVDQYSDLAYLTQDPAEELYRALRGEPLTVRPGDDDEAHIAMHTEQFYTIPQLRSQLAAHIQQHEDQKRQKFMGRNTNFANPASMFGAVPAGGAPPIGAGGYAGQSSPMQGGSNAGLPIGSGVQQLRAI